MSKAETLFRGVTPIHISAASFQEVRLTLNTNHYRMPIDLCRMLIQLSMPAQSGEKQRFRDLLQTRNHFKILGHDVWIRSLDLNQPWQVIEKRLLDIMAVQGIHIRYSSEDSI